ncbi:MAG TPA: hypothetical protein VHZ96_26470 [Frankiaceae bacterium]|jgi:hypothetical protein|nr:hypothetical protein [Frankiaceae bacterium]
MTVVQEIVRRPDGTAWQFGEVTVGLVGAGFDGAGGQVIGVAKTLADDTGLASFDLEPNATGEYYVWTGPDRQQYKFGPVPDSGGPFALETLVVFSPPAALPPSGVTTSALTAALAGERAISNDAYAPVASLSSITSNAQTDTYTLVLADAGKVVEGNKATAFTITIPPVSSVAFPVGTVLEIFQLGAGQLTVAAGVGVTLHAPFGAKTAAQYSSIGLRMRANDEWCLSGDTTT